MEISKQEYIVRNFAKLKHKKWELYVITRVFHRLSDLDVEFICQQPIWSAERKRKLSLVDMYFPQFNICLEIDEKHHNNEDQKRRDEDREERILDKRRKQIGIENNNTLRIERIKIANLQGEDHNILEINSQIDSFIDKLRKEKEQKGTLTWNHENKFSATPFINKGCLRVEDRPMFRHQKIALRCFGYTGGHYQQASWRPNPSKFDFQVWFVHTKHKDWDNSLSGDGLVLTETLIKKCKAEERKQLQNDRDIPSCVFVRQKDDLARTLYRFMGIFKKNDGPRRDDSNQLQWEYKRISSVVELFPES
jgi:hypothetical protein